MYVGGICGVMGAFFYEQACGSAEAMNERFNALGAARPAILRQKFNNLGPYWSEATDDYLLAYPHEDKFMTKEKMATIIRFIDINSYHVVWQNQWFVLYDVD